MRGTLNGRDGVDHSARLKVGSKCNQSTRREIQPGEEFAVVIKVWVMPWVTD